MRFKALKAAALLALVCAAAPAQDTTQNDQKVIEDFVGSRGISFDEPVTSSPAKAKPRPTPRTSRQGGGSKAGTAASKKPGAKAGANSTAASKPQPPAKSNGAGADDGGGAASGGEAASDGAATPAGGASFTKASLRPIGLGYTIFMKDRAGGLTATEPTRVFKQDDAVAIALETNTDGYLYVFNAEDGQKPVMLFPHVLLDGGANKVNAHEYVTYPADVKYSFVFDERPATEHFYIIVSRQPLADVPTGEALAKTCRTSPEDCYWEPSAELWEKLRGGAPGSRAKESKSVLLAQTQAPVQPESLTRGIKVKKNDPAPAVVRVNDSPTTNMLVTRIELVHK